MPSIPLLPETPPDPSSILLPARPEQRRALWRGGIALLAVIAITNMHLVLGLTRGDISSPGDVFTRSGHLVCWMVFPLVYGWRSFLLGGIFLTSHDRGVSRSLEDPEVRDFLAGWLLAQGMARGSTHRISFRYFTAGHIPHLQVTHKRTEDPDHPFVPGGLIRFALLDLLVPDGNPYRLAFMPPREIEIDLSPRSRHEEIQLMRQARTLIGKAARRRGIDPDGDDLSAA